MEQLIALVYTSKANSKTDLKTLREILEISQSRNSQDQISGFLSIRDGVYLQLLEGPKVKVLACFERILHDRRHSQIVLQGLGDIENRALPDWSMGIIDSNGPDQTAEILSLFESGRAGSVYKDQQSLLALLRIFTRGTTIKVEPDLNTIP